MIFNENINNNLNINKPDIIIKQMNLFISDLIYDEQRILKLCNLVASIGAGYITLNYLFVSKIWKWLEKSNIKICAFIDLDDFIVAGQLDKSMVSSSIKNTIINGANVIDIKKPNCINLDDIINLLIASVDGKTDLLKLTIDKDKINTTEKIDSFLNKIYSKNIFQIKTEEFYDNVEKSNNFKTKITDINAIIDFIQRQKIEHIFKLDIVSNYKDENGFDFYDSTHMLYQSIFKDELFYKNCIFTQGLLGLNKIFQQSSL